MAVKEGCVKAHEIIWQNKTNGPLNIAHSLAQYKTLLRI